MQVHLMTGSNLVVSSQFAWLQFRLLQVFLPVLRSHMFPHGDRGGAGPGSSLAGPQHMGLPTSPTSPSFLPHQSHSLLSPWPGCTPLTTSSSILTNALDVNFFSSFIFLSSGASCFLPRLHSSPHPTSTPHTHKSDNGHLVSKQLHLATISTYSLSSIHDVGQTSTTYLNV